ncbi:hypothetical protein VINE108274_20560 [Vibrio neptunius]
MIYLYLGVIFIFNEIFNRKNHILTKVTRTLILLIQVDNDIVEELITLMSI